MRRRHVLAVLLAASVAVVAACGAQVRESGGGGGGQGGGGGEGENAPVQLAVVPKAIGFDFWEQVRLGAECAAQKASGQVDVQWDGVTSETDVNGQVNLLQNFITQGVDGLVYAATDAKVLSKVTQSAKQQGVTVVNIDSGTDPQPSDVPVFATDNVAAAEQVPELIAKELGKEGGRSPSSPSSRDPHQRAARGGLQEGPEEAPRARARRGAVEPERLQQGPPGHRGHPDRQPQPRRDLRRQRARCARRRRGRRQAGKAGDIVIIGWDASSEEVQGVEDGVISALVVQNPFRMGYDGTNAAVKIIREGAKVESEDTGLHHSHQR